MIAQTELAYWCCTKLIGEWAFQVRKKLYLGTSLIREVCVCRLIKDMSAMSVCLRQRLSLQFSAFQYGYTIIISRDRAVKAVPNQSLVIDLLVHKCSTSHTK